MRNSTNKNQVTGPSPSELTTRFASNFTFLLQSRGAPLSEVSEKTGISISDLNKISNGKFRVTATALTNICNYFCVSMDVVLRHDLSKEITDYHSYPLPSNPSLESPLPSPEDAGPDKCPTDNPEKTSLAFYQWLRTKGIMTINTPLDDIRQYTTGHRSNLLLSGNATFEQRYSLTAILNINYSENSPKPLIQALTATLTDTGDATYSISTTFNVPECRLLHLTELFNLLSGRSVYKVLDAFTPRHRAVWLKLDFSNKNSPNQYKLITYRLEYGFQLDSLLSLYDIVECDTPDGKNNLIRSLKQGDKVLVAFRGSQIDLKYIEADPATQVIKISRSNLRL